MMNKKNLSYIIAVVPFVVFIVLELSGCASVPPKWKDIAYSGESEKILAGNIWSYQNQSETLEIEFQPNGKLISTYRVPSSAIIPTNPWSSASWERVGTDVKIVLGNGRNHIEGVYDSENNTISGTLFNSDDTSSRVQMEFICKAESLTGITYKIGDRGPAGGIIFYDKSNYFYGWRYMEAAPVDLRNAVWGPIQFWVDVTTGGSVMGAGKQNTERLVEAYSKAGVSGTAAQLCSDYSLNGYDDWFLPSYDELNYLYLNLKKSGLGGFKDTFYWSSSQGSSLHNGNYNAWAKDFNTATSPLFLDIQGKDIAYSVRAIRIIMER